MNKIVKAGIFWEVPNGCGEWGVLECSKNFYTSEADGNGFVNYPYSHLEMWDEVGIRGEDCYEFPRGRVIYDTRECKHLIYADECVSEAAIDEIVSLYGIEKYEVRRDEHYVCAGCVRRGKAEKPILTYEILRGKDKIGENLIEITYGDTRILVELGKALDGEEELSEIEEATLRKHYDAVVISHYHADHAGLIKYKRDCPIYIGGGAYRVVKAMSEYHGEQMPKNVLTYRSGRQFAVGKIKVTPYLCDHSAFDSYMLLFESGGESILYTGDFRFHGRKNGKNLLAALPKNVDVLIHEGTNLGKNFCTMTESELEERAVGIMNETDGPVFVLQSGTNIDRLVSIYRASKRSGRILYMDNYASLIAGAAGGKIPRPDEFRDVFAFTPHRLLRGKRRDMFLEITNKRGLESIAGGTERFTMLVRSSMLDYIKKLFAATGFKEATLIYSMWKGYKEREDMTELLSEMKALGINIVDLHTSGHACAEDIELLKEAINAKQNICVHTEFHG